MSAAVTQTATTTPGPWRVERTHPQNACAYVVAKNGDEVAILFSGDTNVNRGDDEIWGPMPVRDANAQLVSAAPDLLEALYLALPYVEVQDGDEHYKPGAVAKTIETMKAAIAKAEGRS